MIKPVSMAILLLLCPLLAAGQSIIGAGAKLTCDKWTRMRLEEKEARQAGALQALVKSTQGEIDWFMGFLSAVQVYRSSLPDLSAVDGNLIRDWMDQYCSRHPKDSAIDGLVGLVNELEAKLPKTKETSPPQECKVPAADEKPSNRKPG